MATGTDPYRAQSRRSSLALVVGAVVLALIAGVVAGKVGLFGLFPARNAQLVGADGQPAIQASDVFGGASTQLMAEPGGPSIDAGAGLSGPSFELGFDPQRPSLEAAPGGASHNVADKMPPDVRAWLNHLERTEAERNRLAKAQLGELMGMMMGMNGAALGDLTAEAFGEESSNQAYDPSKRDEVKKGATSKRQAWRDLNEFFNSKQPPAECVPIKNAYEQCLGETSSMMLDVLAELERSNSDPQGAVSKLISMMGTSGGRIDVAANQTDDLVARICRKYEAYKWFSVSGDIGGGLGGLGLGGLGGGGLGDLGGLLGGG